MNSAWILELVSRPEGYTTSTGVTATREGLVIENNAPPELHGMIVDWPVIMRLSGYAGVLVPWPDAAERLRYPGHGPWALVPNKNRGDGTKAGPIICGNKPKSPQEYRLILRRVAAQLADDGVAFHIIYWCVTELGGEQWPISRP